VNTVGSTRNPQSRLSILTADVSTLPLFSGKPLSFSGLDEAARPSEGEPSRSGGAAGGAPPLDLTSGHLTYSEGTPEYNMYFRDYHHGVVDGSLIRANIKRRGKMNHDSVQRGASESRGENMERSAKRAKREIFRKVVFSRLDYLLTLTYRENVLDIGKVRSDTSLFCARVKVAIRGWKHLCVVERQQRGSFHPHICVDGWQDVRLLRKIWLGIVGEGNGNIDVASPPKGKTRRWGRVALARYICKYITKDFGEHLLNKKQYFHSKNVESPQVQKLSVRGSFETAMSWMRDIIHASGGRVKTTYEDPRGFFVWMSTV